MASTYRLRNHPLPLRLIAALLVVLEILPSSHLLTAQTVSTAAGPLPTPGLQLAPVLTPENVPVNRTVPLVESPQQVPTFSSEPKDAEFLRARVFSKVKSKGPWDFKNGPWPDARKYEDFGNFHYGATGSALGIDSWTLQNEAGIVQQNDPSTKNAGRDIPGNRFKSGSGVAPYGDEPKDHDWIKKGIDYNNQLPVGKGPGPCK